MNKKQIAIGGLLAVAILFLGILIWDGPQVLQRKVDETAGGPFILGTHCYLGNSLQGTSSFAVSYLTTSTTTFDCYIARADKVDLNIRYTASTTSSRLEWKYEFSNDKIDWKAEDGTTVDSNTEVTHGAGMVVHKWTPGTTSTSSKNITISPTASKWLRVNFTSAAANGALWAEIITREEDR